GKTTKNVGTNDEPLDIVLQSDGKILLTCYTVDMEPKYKLLRFDSNGSIDSGFGTNGVSVNGGLSIALQNDGKILVGSRFQSSSGSVGMIQRLNTDGSIDNTFAVATDNQFKGSQNSVGTPGTMVAVL